MRRITARAISVLLALSVAVPLASAIAQGLPTAADESFTVEGLCEFPVHFEVRGNMKTVELPGERMLFIFPGLTATLTNVDNPANQDTGRHRRLSPDGPGERQCADGIHGS